MKIYAYDYSAELQQRKYYIDDFVGKDYWVLCYVVIQKMVRRSKYNEVSGWRWVKFRFVTGESYIISLLYDHLNYYSEDSNDNSFWEDYNKVYVVNFDDNETLVHKVAPKTPLEIIADEDIIEECTTHRSYGG